MLTKWQDFRIPPYWQGVMWIAVPQGNKQVEQPNRSLTRCGMRRCPSCTYGRHGLTRLPSPMKLWTLALDKFTAERAVLFWLSGIKAGFVTFTITYSVTLQVWGLVGLTLVWPSALPIKGDMHWYSSGQYYHFNNFCPISGNAQSLVTPHHCMLLVFLLLSQ